MTLEEIYFISQIIAVLGIMLSLIFVGLQIRQNTRATRAASAFEVNRMWAELNLEAARNGEYAQIVRKLFDPATDVEAFADEEKARAELMIFGLVQAHLAQFRLYREGSLLERDWLLHGKWAARFRHLPLVALFYENAIASDSLDEEFLEELDRLEAMGLAGSARPSSLTL